MYGKIDLEHLYYHNIKQLNYALPKVKIDSTWMVPLKTNRKMTEYTLLCTLNDNQVNIKHLRQIAKDCK